MPPAPARASTTGALCLFSALFQCPFKNTSCFFTVGRSPYRKHASRTGPCEHDRRALPVFGTAHCYHKLYIPNIGSASAFGSAIEKRCQNNADDQTAYMRCVVNSGAGKTQVQGKSSHNHQLAAV